MHDIQKFLETLNTKFLFLFLFLLCTFCNKIYIYIDNEYNDCSNPVEALQFWRMTFDKFEDKWDNNVIPFRVQRDPLMSENFYFTYKRTLFIGLNIVGGTVHDREEWSTRLTYEFNWTRELINSLVLTDPTTTIKSVVLFGHGYPSEKHAEFFDPLQVYVKDVLQDRIPMMYIHGDKHYFESDDKFLNSKNFFRIMVEGGDNQPALQVTVTIPEDTGNDKGLKAKDVFSFDRML